MHVDFEHLGKDRVVISLKDFEYMLDLIAYDEAKARPQALFPGALALKIVEGQSPLKAFRKYRGLTQSRLSEKSGIAQAQISALESGKAEGSLKSLKALAHALDVELSMLL